VNWIRKLVKAQEPEVVVVRRSKYGYEIHSDGQSCWKVVTDEDRFRAYVERLEENVFGSDKPESD
jgi:hypothetical protein